MSAEKERRRWILRKLQRILVLKNLIVDLFYNFFVLQSNLGKAVDSVASSVDKAASGVTKDVDIAVRGVSKDLVNSVASPLVSRPAVRI